MTATNWAKIKADAQNTLESIDMNKLTKESYELLGASLAILDHIPDMASAMTLEPREHTPEYYAEDELNAAAEYHAIGLDWIARDELQHAKYWIEQLTKDKARKYATRYGELEKQIGAVANPGILDDFSVILSRYGNSRNAADRDEMRATLKQQLGEIEKELVEMRMEVHDESCVKLFQEFRENIRLKI